MESLGSCSGLADVIGHNDLTVLKLTCLTCSLKDDLVIMLRTGSQLNMAITCDCHTLTFCMVCGSGDNDGDYNEQELKAVIQLSSCILGMLC